MRRLIDSFTDLHIVLRIGIIIALVGLIVLGVMRFMDSDDTSTNEDVAGGDPAAVTEPEANPDGDVTVTNEGESQLTPEEEAALDESNTEETSPEETMPDEFAEIDEDPALALPEEDEDLNADPESEDDSTLTTPSIIDEDDDETNPASDTESSAGEASQIKSEQEDYIQDLWDDLNWTPVTLQNVNPGGSITVDFYDGDTGAIEQFGGQTTDIALLSVDIPSQVEDQAMARINEFLSDADVLVIEPDNQAPNGNTVYIHADFVNLQEVLLEEGLATVTDRDGETKYMDSFKEYEDSAKDDQLGVWGE